MKNFLTVQVVPRLAERSTVLGVITLVITLLHADMSNSTQDLLATLLSSAASLALIMIRERTQVVIKAVTPEGVVVEHSEVPK